MRRINPFLALCGGLAIALVIGCGGDKNDDANAAGDSGGGSGSGAAAAPLNLSTTAEKLASLRSFRFDFSMKMDIPASTTGSADDDAFGAAIGGALLGLLGDIRAEGAVVAPDQMEVKMTFAGQEMAVVQIGNDAWMKMGPTWQKTTAAAAGLDFGSPADLFSDFLPEAALSGAKTSQENVNGVRTTRYSFDKKALEKLALETGEAATGLEELTDAKMDIWINGDSIPVKVVMDMAGKDESGQQMSVKLEMNVRDINSDSVKIRPPV
jgi:hypothetical protein